MPRPGVGIAVLISASLVSAGCATDGEWSVRKAIGWEEVKTPAPPKLPPASIQTAERVEVLGRKIIVQNTFPGVEPLFHTIGVPESMLFHRGPEELFISEGLVNQCKSEAELAAVLCAELGQMVAEKKSARRVGADRDSFPEIGLASGASVMSGGGTPDNPGRQAELAYQEKRPKSAPSVDPVDSAKSARDLLSGAGFDPAELDRVQPLLKQSDRGALLRKQMSGSAPAPRWNN